MPAAEVNEETKEEAEEDTCFDLDLTWFSVIFCCYLFRRITIKTIAKKTTTPTIRTTMSTFWKIQQQQLLSDCSISSIANVFVV